MFNLFTRNADFCCKHNLRTVSVVCFYSRLPGVLLTPRVQGQRTNYCAKISAIFPATMIKIRNKSKQETDSKL